VQRPGLKIDGKLTDRAATLFPRIARECLPALLAPSSFGGLAPADLLRSDVDVKPIVTALDRNDPETLTVRTPLRVEQGLSDTTVFPVFTERLVTALRKRGTKVTVANREGVDHGSIVKVGARSSTAWIAQRLKR